MLTDEVKRRILQGEYATDGIRKLKYLGKRYGTDVFLFAEVVSNEGVFDGEIIAIRSYWKSNFSSWDKSNHETDKDIIGLWEEKGKIFNTKRALAGAPVKLRNGTRAFLLANLSPTSKSLLKERLGSYDLVGFAEDNPEQILQWNEKGEAVNNTPESYSIIEMWV